MACAVRRSVRLALCTLNLGREPIDQSRSRRTLACHYNLQRDIPPAGEEISHVILWMVGSRCNWLVFVCWIGRASCSCSSYSRAYSSCSAVLLLWLLCVAPCLLTEYAPGPKDMRWHAVVCHPSSRHLISRFASCVCLHAFTATKVRYLVVTL